MRQIGNVPRPIPIVATLALAMAIAAAIAMPASPPASAASGQTHYLPLMFRPESWITILRDGFEAPFPGPWVTSSSGAQATWNRTACRQASGSYSAWAIGNPNAANCQSTYPPNMKGWMVYGPFSLVGANAAAFTFDSFMQTSLIQGTACNLQDNLFWGASTDGQNFYGRTACGVSPLGWGESDAVIDLSAIADVTNPGTTRSMLGAGQVWIGFSFSSDSGGPAYAGAFVDDVVLRRCSEPTCPTFVSGATAAGSDSSGSIVVESDARTRP